MEDSLMETLCGTPLYMAPTILKGGQIKYTNKADLWSVGCILYEMLFGKPPYGAKNQKELFDNIQGKRLDFPQNPQISKEALDLLKKLLMKEYADRISWVDYFDHFWFTKKKRSIENRPSLLPSPTIKPFRPTINEPIPNDVVSNNQNSNNQNLLSQTALDSLFTDVPVLNAKFLTSSVTTLDHIENYGTIVRELEELARKKIDEKKKRC